MTIHYYDLIPRDAHALHWAVNSTNYSETAASRICYAISAIAISIFNAHWYLGRTLIDRNWDDISEAGRSLAFALATLHNIFYSFMEDNVFAAPRAQPMEHHPGHGLLLPEHAGVLPPPLVYGKEYPAAGLDVFSPPVLDHVEQQETGVPHAFSPPVPEQETEQAEPKAIDLTYNSIPISHKEFAALQVIAVQIGTATFWSPPNPVKTMRAGAEANDLHPLRFIGFFCSDKILDRGKTPKELLRAIRYGGDGTDKTGPGFYWGKFVGPMADSFQKRLEQGEIYPYLKSFAAEVGGDQKRIASFFKPLNCTELVDYLLGL